MRINQINELVEAGRKLDVKVTPDKVAGQDVVNIRDFQFSDFAQAALLLQYIAKTEIPDNYNYYVC
jgi:hypothetical protein